MLAPGMCVQQRYRIVRTIGQGGMGAVYEAIDERLGSSVALKQFAVATHVSPQDVETLRQAFAREARILAQLHHQALPNVIDHFSDPAGQFLVMSFFPGPDLGMLLEQRNAPFPLADVLRWAEQLLDLLVYLHQQQIIHRDIKPHNLKFTDAGSIVLLDFGLAKGTATAYNRALTQASVYAYTLGYAPFEQIQGTGTDARSDLYSLAATLYHLATHVAPPDALTRAGALLGRQPDPLRAPHTLNPHLPRHFSDALLHALAVHASDRTPDALTMQAELCGTPELGIATGHTIALPQSPHAGSSPERTPPQSEPIRTWQTRQLPTWVPELVKIPAGFFLMGSSDDDLLLEGCERPQHAQELPTYWIGKTPVTNAQFHLFVASDGYSNPDYWTWAGWRWRELERVTMPRYWDNSKWNRDDYPVVGISWYEAVAYACWLAAQTGIPFRLPTEAEWEKAARGPDGWIWPWGNTWKARHCNAANDLITPLVRAFFLGGTTPVHRFVKGASPYGVLDMAGNVWEWCLTKGGQVYPYLLEDEWTEEYLAGETPRTIRGGAWVNGQKQVRTAYRDNDFPRGRSLDCYGMRVAVPEKDG